MLPETQVLYHDNLKQLHLQRATTNDKFNPRLLPQLILVQQLTFPKLLQVMIDALDAPENISKQNLR